MIELPENPTMKDFQQYIHALEKMHGWLDVDLVHNCFLLGEEVGELFRAIRKHIRLFDQAEKARTESDGSVDHVAEEIVDVFNYLLALANRLEIDLEKAFIAKNARNQTRSWV